jgi:hypothetical protein
MRGCQSALRAMPPNNSFKPAAIICPPLMKPILLAFLLLFSCLPSIAWPQEHWHDRQGRLIPESDVQKSIEGFAGLLIVTPDEDWYEKWNTSAETVPEFTALKGSLHNGDRLFILTVLSNPGVSSDGKANVLCDLKVTRPDGTISTDVIDSPCFQAALAGGSHNLYLSELVSGFLAEPSDLRGKWIVAVTLKDKIRNVAITLKSSFLVE